MGQVSQQSAGLHTNENANVFVKSVLTGFQDCTGFGAQKLILSYAGFLKKIPKFRESLS